MPVSIRDASNVLRPITGLKMRDAGNVLRPITTLKMRGADNVLRTVFSLTSGATAGGLTATPSSTTATKTAGTSGGSKVVTTPTVTVSVSGGSGSYTFVWGWVLGDPAITATASTGATSAFSATLGPDETKFAEFVCTVTEAVTGRTATATVNVELYLVLTSGGIQP